jgi:hypothetical protein
VELFTVRVPEVTGYGWLIRCQACSTKHHRISIARTADWVWFDTREESDAAYDRHFAKEAADEDLNPKAS